MKLDRVFSQRRPRLESFSAIRAPGMSAGNLAVGTHTQSYTHTHILEELSAKGASSIICSGWAGQKLWH